MENGTINSNILQNAAQKEMLKNTNSMQSNQHQMQSDNLLFSNHNMTDLAGPLNSLPYQQKNKMLHLIDHFKQKK